MKPAISSKNQRGVGLIEVLVTLLVLSTSLLALAAMQMRSLQFNQGAYMRSQANIYAYDMLDRMRLNITNLGNYESALASVDPESTPVESPLAAADLDAWRRNIASALPHGRGGIDWDAARSCTLTIDWDELNTSGRDDEDEEKTVFTYSAKL